MEWEIQWGGDPEDVLVTISGDATVEGLNAWTQEALADSRFRPGLRVLIDHRSASLGGLTSDDMRRRADILAADAERIGLQRVATVVTKPVDFGMHRMLDLLSEERRSFTWRVFYSIEDAREWLGQSD